MHDTVIRKVSVRQIVTASRLPVCDFCANPYTGCTHACAYCYASFMKRFVPHSEEWGQFLDVKYWPPLEHVQKYRGKEIFLSSVTDPYNPQEAEFKRTRALLEELRDSGARLSISTKSDLILRDIDLIAEFDDPRVSFSINTLDEDFRRDMDRAVSIKRRLEAMKLFHERGIRTTCFISPIFPGITDVEEIIMEAKDCCNLIWLENLNLRGAFRPVIMKYISQKHPELYPLYERIYTRHDLSYWQELDRQTAALAARLGLEYRINDDSMRRDFSDPPVIVNFFYHDKIRKGAGKC